MANKDWVRTGVSWSHRPTGKGDRKVRRENLAERERALSRAPLFAGLPKKDIRTVARASGIADYGEGELVVKEGAAGSVFYVLLEGRARVIRRGRTVARLTVGDFFGEMSLLDGGPRTASVVTESMARFLTLSGKAFRDLLAEDGVLAARVLKVMAARIRENEKPPVG
jgi:CRP/FNR family cyclic AMP-dependent transcriptional regulator